MITKRTIMAIGAIMFCAANTYNIVQNEKTNNSITNFISLSSGDIDDIDKIPGTKAGGNSRPHTFTCYVVQCVSRDAMISKDYDANSIHYHYFNTRKEAEESISAYNKWVASFASYPDGTYSKHCKNEPVRFDGQDCDNTSAIACTIIDCTSYGR